MGERERGWRSGLGLLASIPLICCCVLLFSGCQGSAPVGAESAQGDPADRPTTDEPVGDEDIVADDPIDERPVDDGPSDDGDTLPDAPEPDDDEGVPSDSDDDEEVVSGDLTGDAAVTDADRDYFLDALNTRAGEAGYDASLDYDGDSAITLRDYQVWFGLAYPES